MVRSFRRSSFLMATSTRSALKQYLWARSAIRLDEVVGALVAIGDMLVMCVMASLAYLTYLAAMHDVSSRDPLVYTAAVLVAGSFFVQRLATAGNYKVEKLSNGEAQASFVFRQWTMTMIIIVVAGFLLKVSDQFSRVWLVAWYASVAISLVLSRLAVAYSLKRVHGRGLCLRSAVLIGAGPIGCRFLETRAASDSLGVRVLGVFDDRRTRIAEEIIGVRLGGKVDDAVSFARRVKADLVLIALPLSADQRIMELVTRLRVLPIDIAILSDSYGFCAVHKPMSYVAGVPAILAAQRPLSTWSGIGKRALDIGIAAPALICLLPALPFIALAVKMDCPGPLFFKQRRFGFNGEIFEIYKFRTMRADQADADGARLVSRGDSRVTRVGSLMRRTSIDELPQLLNVLRGEMSLVGPRPHPLQARAADRLYNEVVAEYMTRHRVKPGITGWAQVNGWRGETDTAEKIRNRVEHDLFYIENFSLAFDIRILFLTLVRGFSGRNAY